jgi:hypothetical protein
MFSPDPAFYTDAVANKLGAHPNTIRRQVRTGLPKAVCIALNEESDLMTRQNIWPSIRIQKRRVHRQPIRPFRFGHVSDETAAEFLAKRIVGKLIGVRL